MKIYKKIVEISMKDKNGNKIMIGDRLKILWTKNNKEYMGNVIGIKGKIVLLSVKNYMVYVNNPNKLLKASIS
ncbi:MAG: hypothetical protein K8R25_09070 [Methanosarcinales archaeon]|nr:hypothetical protein [Methanosarcinales archaeon]